MTLVYEQPDAPEVDPELRPGLEVIAPFTLTDETLPIMRAGLKDMALPDELWRRPGIEVEEQRTEKGVRFFLYRPETAKEPLPLFLFFHGGGYVLGTVESTHAGCVRTADEVGCVVVSVDYRLAPETRAPGQLEDGYDVLAHVVQHAAELGIDPARIAIGGESAGGGLAAAFALMVRDRGEHRLCFQQLIYPMLDDRSAITPPVGPGVGRYIWTAEHNHFGWQALLGVAPGSDSVPPYSVAARAEDLSGLPPTYLSVGQLDLFAEENIAYARRLMAAGVPVELHVYPRAYHGYEMAPKADTAQRSEEERCHALRRAFRKEET